MLCPQCENIRFPTNEKEKDKATATTDADAYSQVILDPVLTYVTHSLGNSSVYSIKQACRGFYTLEEVNVSKDILWKVGDNNVLPPFVRRRDSTKGNEIDKVIDDIVIGIQKLDAASSLPPFAVDPSALNRIPKASPAETFPISVCERLNLLEAKVSQLPDLEERIKQAEIKMERVPASYAAAAASNEPNQIRVQPPTSLNAPANASTSACALPGPLHVKLPPVKASSNISSWHDRAVNKALGKAKATAAAPLYGSQASLASSGPSWYDEGFDYTGEQKKKKMKRVKNRKAVTGTSTMLSGKLKGAPEPSRDIFVYRVVKDTTESEIQDYIVDNNIAVRGVSKVSNTEARFDSFRVEIKVSDLNQVLNASFWPEGICVRRFFKPKPSNTPDLWE